MDQDKLKALLRQSVHLKWAIILSQPAGRSCAAVLATLLWGSAFPVVKIGYAAGHISRGETFQQLVFAGWRFALAGMILSLVSWSLGQSPWPGSRRQVYFGLRMAAIQTFLQYLFFYVGIAYCSGISGSLLAGTLTFFQLAIAHVRHSDDQLTVHRVSAAVAGFSAVALYFIRQSSEGLHFGWGETAMLVAMFFAALGNVLNREAVSVGWRPLQLTAWQMLIGGAAMTVVGLYGGGAAGIEITNRLLLVLLYLASVSACSFLLWNSLMAYNQTSSISVFLFLVPVFGVALSSIALGEIPDPSLLLVLIIVAASVFWAQRG